MGELLAALAALGPTIPYAGLIALNILAIMRGWLVPGNIVKDRIKDKDDEIQRVSTERDTWREAYQKSEESRAVLNKNMADLLDQSEATTRLLDTLRNQVERGDYSGRQPQYYQMPPQNQTQIGQSPTYQGQNEIGGRDGMA